MNKKYQVFISSTYEDLKEERQKVIEALLGKNCIPVGMEYFSAADDDQFTVIKKLISKCDYYIVIVGGRYGSIEPNSQKSYTQLEYEYAQEIGVPTAAFIRKDIEKLPYSMVEKTPALDSFKDYLKHKLCRFWKDSYELAFEVSKSLDYLFENNPRDGWVSATEISSAEANSQILKLLKENALLKKELEHYRTPLDIEGLSGGDDEVILHLKNRILDGIEYQIKTSWDELFLYLSDELLSSSTKKGLHKSLERIIFDRHPQIESSLIVLDQSYLDQILVQFIALGWITSRTGENNDSGSYTLYSLTKIGLDKMIAQKALRKGDTPINIG